MTGAQLLTAVSQGTWTVTQDAGTPGTVWGAITWNTEPQGSVPAGASIKVEARAAETEAGLGSATFAEVTNGTAFSMVGRFIQVRVTLTSNAQDQSPVLSDIRIRANDVSTPQTLTVTKEGTGTGSVGSSPAGITCGADCSEAYDAGTVVTLTATPDANSTFTEWGGDGASCGSATTCQVTMDAAKVISATFTLIPPETFVLTVSTQGTGTGSVGSSPAGITCGADCSETFDAGTVVTLTATPDANSIFTGWSGACTGTGPCTVTMDEDRAVTATFDVSSQPSPRVLKRDAVASLRALLPTGDPRTDRKIEQAIKEIEDSLDPQLWLDDSHLTDKGKKVFHEEREAANKLMQIKDPPAEVASVLDALVAADQALARTAIDEATAAGGDPRKLADAESQMAKASEEIGNGRLARAITHYGLAWTKAQKAVR
jgi:hypothetical protein